MDVQIVKLSLTAEESAQILPVLVQAIAGHGPSALTEIYSENPPEPPPDFDGFQEPSALPAPPQTDRDVEQTVTRIARPTGKLSKAKTMVWDVMQRRYVRRTFVHRVKGQVARMDAIARAHPNIFVSVVGLLIGFAALAVVWRTGLLVEVVNRIEDRLKETTAIPVPVEIAPVKTAPTPGDASSKAGQNGKKPPMQSGALEE
ncbi:MAG: hypothetical protein DCF25_16505 [Leptolyngbya foveolarum]|uniref:Uncharacterized protein n=1 Tax=Leptolyngbya foveolarum TaxID=47253 RepID=A0A2W4U256_9CYAN|nr:MAG: hypothetical protein DCF25_16505 [Leptolyngbya foveolarum]